MSWLNHDARLLLIALAAVAGLVLLIARFKVNAFIALMLAALFVGLTSGMQPVAVAKAFQDGFGATLSGVAVVVGLGAMLGKLLAESGGAEVVARAFVRAFGERRLHWAMLAIALVIGIPTWFTVGLVLLVPILFSILRETRQPLLPLALPLCAGLSVMHGLAPPHPGPVVAIEALKADMGKTILWSLLIGVPAAFVAGPVFARWVGARVPVDMALCLQQAKGAFLTGQEAASQRTSAPGLGLTLTTILLPVALMLTATLGEVFAATGSATRSICGFIGHPSVAMLASVLFAFWSFGAARGFDRARLLKFTEECLGPVALVVLIVGAGGGFNRVLKEGGVADAIAHLARDSQLSPLLLGWLVAAVIRVATGSATVAITASAGLLAQVVTGRSDVNLELLVVAMGAGSLILSHLNDGGFWFVKEYLGLSVTQTLKTWTVLETIASVVALLLALALDAVF